MFVARVEWARYQAANPQASGRDLFRQAWPELSDRRLAHLCAKSGCRPGLIHKRIAAQSPLHGGHAPHAVSAQSVCSQPIHTATVCQHTTQTPSCWLCWASDCYRVADCSLDQPTALALRFITQRVFHQHVAAYVRRCCRGSAACRNGLPHRLATVMRWYEPIDLAFGDFQRWAAAHSPAMAKSLSFEVMFRLEDMGYLRLTGNSGWSIQLCCVPCSHHCTSLSP